MLELDDKLRTRLLVSGALTVNGDGDEVFIGLTVAESEFFLLFEQDPGDGHASVEDALYLELKHRHIAARSAAIFEECTEQAADEKRSPAR